MAESITIKALQDASLDAKSLEEVVNGDEAKQVTTRKGETYPSVKKAIKTLFENGGLPATPFKTKALMTASSLANDKYAMVTDDTVADNNGLYVKTAGVWVKSKYDVERSILELFRDRQDLAFEQGYIQSNGIGTGSAPATHATFDYIKTHSGDKLITKGSPSGSATVTLFTYDDNKGFISRNQYGISSDDRVFELGEGYVRVSATIYDADGVSLSVNRSVLEQVKQRFYLEVGTQHKRYVEKSEQYHQLSVEIPLEVGDLQKEITSTEFVRNLGFIRTTAHLDADYNFLGEWRSSKPLEVIPDTRYSIDFNAGDNARAYIFEYDEDYKYIYHTESLSSTSYLLTANTKYIKIMLEQVTEPYPTASISFLCESAYPNFTYNPWQSNRASDYNLSFIFEAYPNSGLQSIEGDLTKGQYDKKRYFSTGLLQLPDSYDPNGEPVRLIIFVQGSGGYLNINAGSAGPTYDGYNNPEGFEGSIFKYWLDEGYAILSVFPSTSKYPSGTVNQSTPTGMAAYSQVYSWAINNFNLKKDGVHIASKSSGGFCAITIPVCTGIPVLCNAVLSPAISPFHEPFGARYENRVAYCEDFGFEGDYSVLAEQTSTPAVRWTDELRDFIRQNAKKTIGYNPYWVGIIGESFDDLVEAAALRKDSDYDGITYADRQRIYPVPLKIWCAEDDHGHGLAQSKEFINSVRNTGGMAELRLMPAGTGGHAAVDTSPDALKVSSIMTKSGVVHTNVPLAMVELIQYLRKFE